MKLLGMYTYYDLKSKRYDTPFFSLDDTMAKRKFIMDIRNENSLIHQFVNDFRLHKIGTFDVESGLIAFSDLELIMDGSEFKNKPEEDKKNA